MIRVKEPQIPKEGEITLTQDTAEAVMYRNGQWVYLNDINTDQRNPAQPTPCSNHSNDL